MSLAEFISKFREDPEGINEIMVDEPSGITGSEEMVRDPNVMDLESFTHMAVFWGDSYFERKISLGMSDPESINPTNTKFVFPLREVLEATKNMMLVGQRKHFVASHDLTITNWFRKLFKSMHKLFGIDAILSFEHGIDGGLSVREFCFRCFLTIQNLSRGYVERDGDLIPSDPDLLIWYMAPVIAWKALILEKVIRIEVYYLLRYFTQPTIDIFNLNYLQDLELSEMSEPISVPAPTPSTVTVVESASAPASPLLAPSIPSPPPTPTVVESASAPATTSIPVDHTPSVVGATGGSAPASPCLAPSISVASTPSAVGGASAPVSPRHVDLAPGGTSGQGPSSPGPLVAATPTATVGGAVLSPEMTAFQQTLRY